MKKFTLALLLAIPFNSPLLAQPQSTGLPTESVRDGLQSALNDLYSRTRTAIEDFHASVKVGEQVIDQSLQVAVDELIVRARNAGISSEQFGFEYKKLVQRSQDVKAALRTNKIRSGLMTAIDGLYERAKAAAQGQPLDVQEDWVATARQRLDTALAGLIVEARSRNFTAAQFGYASSKLIERATLAVMEASEHF